MTTKPSTTTQTRELEPCPRGHTGAQVCNSDERMFYVTCVDHECFWTLGEGYDRDAMPDHAFRSEEEAIEAWNTRAPSDTEQVTRDDDDGAALWCDDCHGYTHKYDCRSKRREATTPVVQQVVDAVYRSMAQYEDGTWWLDNLRAQARVRRLLAVRDTEQVRLREALEGLLEFSEQVIEVWNIRPIPAHRLCLERARELLAPKAETELEQEK